MIFVGIDKNGITGNDLEFSKSYLVDLQQLCDPHYTPLKYYTCNRVS